MVEFRYLNYCGNCAGKLIKENMTLYMCEDCKKPTFNSAVATAGVVVFDGTRVLISRRAIEPRIGELDLIGGFLDFYEDPKKAIVREFKEETGADITHVEIVDASYGRYTEYMSTCDIIYLAKLKKDAALKPQDDVAELIWVELDDLTDDKFDRTGLLGIIKKGYIKNEEVNRNV